MYFVRLRTIFFNVFSVLLDLFFLLTTRWKIVLLAVLSPSKKKESARNFLLQNSTYIFHLLEFFFTFCCFLSSVWQEIFSHCNKFGIVFISLDFPQKELFFFFFQMRLHNPRNWNFRLDGVWNAINLVGMWKKLEQFTFGRLESLLLFN